MSNLWKNYPENTIPEKIRRLYIIIYKKQDRVIISAFKMCNLFCLVADCSKRRSEV